MLSAILSDGCSPGGGVVTIVDFNSLPLTGWFPGHMLKASQQMRETLKLIDLVVEVVDARIPASSRNPAFDRLFQEKPRFVIFNKVDLADPAKTKVWKEWYEARGIHVSSLSAVSGQGVMKLVDLWRGSFEEIRRRRGATQPLRRPVRVMISGVPNVGKSTLINKLAYERRTAVGPLPGVTRSTQWIPIKGAVELLDTPGILWPKIRNKEHELRLGLCGCVKDDVLGVELLGEFLWHEMRRIAQGVRWDFYGLREVPATGEAFLQAVAQRRGMLRPGGVPDLERSAGTVLREFRDGKLGRLTFELPSPEVGDEGGPDA